MPPRRRDTQAIPILAAANILAAAPPVELHLRVERSPGLPAHANKHHSSAMVRIAIHPVCCVWKRLGCGAGVEAAAGACLCRRWLGLMSEIRIRPRSRLGGVYATVWCSARGVLERVSSPFAPFWVFLGGVLKSGIMSGAAPITAQSLQPGGAGRLPGPGARFPAAWPRIEWKAGADSAELA